MTTPTSDEVAGLIEEAIEVKPETIDAAIRADLWAPDVHAIVDAVNATSDAGDLSTEQCIALGVLLERERRSAIEPVEATVEPVAWRWRWGKLGGNTAWHLSLDKPGPFPEEGYDVEPLYTSPPTDKIDGAQS